MNIPWTTWAILLGAIVSETIATTALQQSDRFSRLWPSVVVVLGYGVSFWLLSITLKTLPIGIAYAVWSGVGIVLVSAIGVFLLGQSLDLAAVIGIGLILAGVVVINLFSRSLGH
jgi:small multidrug resistance pump